MDGIISYGRFQCKELAPHKNRGMEISFIEAGMLEWMVDGKPETVDAGSIFFTLPWQVHGGTTPKQPHNRLCHVLFHIGYRNREGVESIAFPQSWGFDHEENETISRALTQSRKHAFRATPAIRWLMPALIRELQSQHALGDAYVISILRTLLIELKRIVVGEAFDLEAHSPTERRVQALIQELAAHCGHPWSLRAMSAFCNIKRTQLNNTFQRLTGCTPIHYLSRLRIERAKTLLRDTDDAITDIAFQCGASSSQYFANLFRRATGMTPSEFRTESTNLRNGTKAKWRDIGFRSEQEEQKRVKAFSETS